MILTLYTATVQIKYPTIIFLTLILNILNYTATQIDVTPHEKICEQTTFCPTEIVRHTMVGSGPST
jgi:disulfide oxidoreductase YuzD